MLDLSDLKEESKSNKSDLIIKREKNSISKKPPLMIACSAHIDEYTRQKAILTGFDLVMEAPL